MATLSSRINTVTSNIKTAKTNLKTAVVNKGGTISASSPTFAQIIAGINSISGAKIQYENYNVLSNSTKEFTYSPIKSTITNSSISSERYFISNHYFITINGSNITSNIVKEDGYIYTIWVQQTASSESKNYAKYNVGIDRVKFINGTEASTLVTISLQFVYYSSIYWLPKILGESYFIVARQYYDTNSYFKILNFSTLTISNFSTIKTNSLRTIAFAPFFDKETGFIYACEDGGQADWLQIYKIDTATATLSNLVSFGAGSPYTCGDIPTLMPNSSSKKIFWTYRDSQSGYNKFGLVYNITSNTSSYTYGEFCTNFKNTFSYGTYSTYFPTPYGFPQEYDSKGNLCFPFYYTLDINEDIPCSSSLSYNFTTQKYRPFDFIYKISNLSEVPPLLTEYSSGPMGYKKTDHFVECVLNKYKPTLGGFTLPNNWNWCYFKKMITYCQLPVFENATYQFDLPIVIHENYKIIKEVATNTSYKLTSVTKETQIAVNLFAIDESSITDTLVLNGTITLPS